MNPYDFVRIDWGKPPERRPPVHHHHFTGWTGYLEGTITAETPFFLPEHKRTETTNLKKFQTNLHGQPIIPGSSLKGLLRSLVETVAPGCWWLYSGQYQDAPYSGNLPPEFKRCKARELCPSCRLFGTVSGDGAFLGKIGFDDAICQRRVDHEPIYTPVLDTPKPRHKAWYLESKGRWVAGRKFYFHQREIQRAEKLIKSGKGQPLNQYIQPLNTGSVFHFRAQFTNLEEQEFPLLLYALVLEQRALGHERDLRHKLGYAKPAGLGSVHIQVERLVRWRDGTRYTRGDVEDYTAAALKDFLNQQTARYRNDTSSVTLQDLRRIWQWPPSGQYRYPDQFWFKNNPQAPINSTP